MHETFCGGVYKIQFMPLGLPEIFDNFFFQCFEWWVRRWRYSLFWGFFSNSVSFMISADDSSFKEYGGFIILFCKLYIMYNVHLQPLFAALFVQLFHFSFGYWLLSLPNVIKCRRHSIFMFLSKLYFFLS